MKKIKLLLADDHAVFRAGLKSLLNAQYGIEVVAEAANGEEAVRISGEVALDIVLMDIAMPGLSGVEATQEIKKRSPEIKVLVLTMHEDESYLYKMLSVGASGYVPKKAADTELVDAIRATYRGEYFIHSSMTKEIVANACNKEKIIPANSLGDERLSPRERDVLQLLAMGHTSQEIADKLYLSIKTVETHKAHIKEKLGLRRLAELVRYAIQVGLLDTKA